MAADLGFNFAVGNKDGPRSSVWRVFPRGHDVYLTEREWAGVAKLSLHKSGICRYALTGEHCTGMAPEGIAGVAKRLKTR